MIKAVFSLGLGLIGFGMLLLAILQAPDYGGFFLVLGCLWVVVIAVAMWRA